MGKCPTSDKVIFPIDGFAYRASIPSGHGSCGIKTVGGEPFGVIELGLVFSPGVTKDRGDGQARPALACKA